MKKILITGAAKNLGGYLAEKLAKNKYSVIVHYNNSKTEAKEVVKSCRLEGVEAELLQGDFSTNESLSDFVSNLKSMTSELYGFIHNVGNFEVGSFLNTPYSKWQELIQVNLNASFYLLKEIIPLLKTQMGHIICMGFAGINNVKADTYCSAYSLTKQALLFMVKTIAKEVSASNIKINMISPGYLEKSVVFPKDPFPMQRPASFEDIFQTVKFLLDHTYITGQNIEVSGGIRLS